MSFNSRLKDTLKAFENLKNEQKSVWTNVFWYIKVCMLWKCIQHTIHWDETQMLKNLLSFLSRGPTHHNFTFN